MAYAPAGSSTHTLAGVRSFLTDVVAGMPTSSAQSKNVWMPATTVHCYIITYLYMPAIPSGSFRSLTRFLQVLLSCALFFDNIINNELFHEQILRNNIARADFELTLKCVTFFLNFRAVARKVFCFITYRPR